MPLISGSGWSAPVKLDAAASTGENARIALDAAGHPHVTWMEGLGGGLADFDTLNIYYADNLGSGWTRELVSTCSDFAYGWIFDSNPEIAMDSSGSPHLVWYENDTARGDYHVFYASKAGGSWSAKQALSDCFEEKKPALAVDAGGNRHAVWEAFYR